MHSLWNPETPPSTRPRAYLALMALSFGQIAVNAEDDDMASAYFEHRAYAYMLAATGATPQQV